MSKARRRHVRLLNIILSHNARIFRYFVHVPSCLKLWQLHILRYFCSPTYILICTYVFPFPQSHSSVHSCACMRTHYITPASLCIYMHIIFAHLDSQTPRCVFHLRLTSICIRSHIRALFFYCV